MYALDFEYDKLCLSDFGFIVCDFNSTTGADIVDAGANFTFHTVSVHRGKKRYMTGTKYESCLQTTIHICKNPDEADDMRISPDEYRDIVRWLCREGFFPLRVIYADDFNRDTCYFNASFSANRIEINKILYGIELTIQTDSPFGYGIEENANLLFTAENLQSVIRDRSDVIGSVYPDMTITCYEDGDLSICNETLGRIMLIKNCVKDEIITIQGEAQIISSSVDSHALYDDFNWKFFMISNSYNDRKNTITVNRPCSIDIRYEPTIFSSP